MSDCKNVLLPIGEKYTLTIAEASRYFNIGEKKLRNIVTTNSELVVTNGVKTLIKRKKFEEFIDNTSSI